MKRVCAIVLLGLLASGCYSAPIQPPLGAIYARIRAPLQADFDETTLGTKHGEASAKYLFVPFLLFFAPVPIDFAWGDATVAKAAEEGNITTVHYADYELLNVVGLYVKFTTHVYGD